MAGDVVAGSGALLRAVSESTSELIYVKDRDSRIVYANPATLAVVGLTEEEAMGNDLAGTFLDDDQARAVRDNDARVMDRGVAETFEEHYTGPTGTRVFASTKTPWRDEEGRVIGLIGVSRDVTERRQAEEVLRRAAAADAYRVALSDAIREVEDPLEVQVRATRLLRRHLRTHGCYFCEVDPEGRCVVLRDHRAGAQLAEHFGRGWMAALRTGRPLVADDVERLTSLDEDERAACALRGIRSCISVPLVRGGQLVAAFGVTDPGVRRWTPHEVAIVQETADRAWTAIEHARAERSLRAHTARFEALLAHVPLGVVLVDADFRVAQVNPVARPFFGDPPGGLVGRDVDELAHQLWERAAADQLVAVLRRTLETGEPQATEEFGCSRADRDAVEHYEWRVDRIDLPDGRHGLVCYFRDISQHVEARTQLERHRDALRASEERFRALTNLVPGIVFTAPPVGYADYANDRWYAFTGSPREVPLHDAFQRALPPEDRDRVGRLWAEAQERGEEFELEIRLRSARGEDHWFLTRALPLRDEQGRLVQWFGLCTDITERRRAEDSLRRSEERFRHLFERAADGILLTTLDGTILEANPSACRILGYEHAELVGQGVASLVDLSDTDVRHLDRLLAGQVVKLERRMRRRDDTTVVVEETARQVDPRTVLSLLRDVTERRRAEEALKESEQRFRTMADGTPVPLWVTNAAGTLLFVNRAYREFFGTTLDEVRSGRWSPPTHPDDAERFEQVFAAAHEARQSFRAVRRVRRADGAWRWVESSGEPRFSASGEFLGHAGSSSDVTEAREAEEALRELDRRKDEFLAVLSHELRNPLAPIRTSAHVLARAVPGSQDAERARQVLERQITHLTRLVDDLLDVTRIARDKVRLRRELVEIGELVRQSLEDHRQQFEARRVTLDARLTSAPVWVEGDATRIQQVVGNLLNNAAKFTDPGGRVTTSLEAQGEEMVLRVRDSGVGIPSELLGRIFEPFAQAEVTLARSRGGLGLGLALVRGLVELHGGRVEAMSEGPGRGACFSVRLPLAHAPAARPEAPAAPVKVEPRRVLVLEDNVDSAEMLKAALELHGHRVEVAHGGCEGLQRARESPPDVVLCDIGLPDLSGYDVARELRDADPRPLLVALTGYGSPEDLRKAAEAGFVVHFTKPPDLTELLRVVGRAPARSPPREQAAQRMDRAG